MARPTLRAKQGTFKDRVAGLGGEVDYFGARWSSQINQLLDAVGDLPKDAAVRFNIFVGHLFAEIETGTPVGNLDTWKSIIEARAAGRLGATERPPSLAGYVGGQARAGWNLKHAQTKDSSVDAFITNVVDYIVYLEFGWSKQAPHGMVRKSMESQRRKLIKQLQRLVTE